MIYKASEEQPNDTEFVSVRLKNGQEDYVQFNLRDVPYISWPPLLDGDDWEESWDWDEVDEWARDERWRWRDDGLDEARQRIAEEELGDLPF